MSFGTRKYAGVADCMANVKAMVCGSALLARSYRTKSGNGTLTPINLSTSGATPQTWTLICTYKGTGGSSYTNAIFSVTSSVSGAKPAYTLSTGTYLVAGQVSFSIAQGGTPFEIGDRITFTSDSAGNISVGSLVYDAVISGGTVVTQIGALPGVRNGLFTLECTAEEEFTISGVEYELPTDVTVTESIKAYAAKHYKKGLYNTPMPAQARLEVTDQVGVSGAPPQTWTLTCISLSGARATFNINSSFAGDVGTIQTSNNSGTPTALGSPANFTRATVNSQVTFDIYDAKQTNGAATVSLYAVNDKIIFHTDANGKSGGNPRVKYEPATPTGTVITFDKFEFLLDRTSRPEIGDKFVIATTNNLPSIGPVVKVLSGVMSSVTASLGSLTGTSVTPDVADDSWTLTYVSARGVFEVYGANSGYVGDATVAVPFDSERGLKFTVATASYVNGNTFTFNTSRATNDDMLVINLYPVNQAEDWEVECTAVDGSGMPTFSVTGSLTGVTTAALNVASTLPAGNAYASSVFAHDNGKICVQFSKDDVQPGGALRFQVGDTFSFSTDVTTVPAWECLADSDLHVSTLETQSSYFYERALNGPFVPSNGAPKSRQVILQSKGSTGTDTINISIEAINYTPSGYTALTLRMFRGGYNKSLPAHRQSVASHKNSIPLMREAGAGSPSAGAADIFTVKFDARLLFLRYQMERISTFGTLQSGFAGYYLPLGTAAEQPFPAICCAVDNTNDRNPATVSNAAYDRAQSWGYAFHGAGNFQSNEDNTSASNDVRVNRAAMIAVPWESKWRSVVGHKGPSYMLEKVQQHQTSGIGIMFSPHGEYSGGKEPIKINGALGGGKTLRPVEIRSGGLTAPDYARGTIGVIPNIYHVGAEGLDPWSTLLSVGGYTHMIQTSPGAEDAMDAAYAFSALRLS